MALNIFALVILLVLACVVLIVIWLVGRLPGQIARTRNHPQSEAVSIAGWCSLLMPIPLWPLAMVWAYLTPQEGRHGFSSPERSE